MNIFKKYKDNIIKSKIEDLLGKYLKNQINLDSDKLNEFSIKDTLLNEENVTESFLKNTPFILAHGEICNIIDIQKQ